MKRTLEPPITEIAAHLRPFLLRIGLSFQRSTDHFGLSEPVGRSTNMSYARSSAYFALIVSLCMSVARAGARTVSRSRLKSGRGLRPSKRN